MTTAHRPTWKAAVGKAQEGGWNAGGAPSTNRSVLDAPSHTKLKTRSDQYALANKSTQRDAILKQSLLKLKEMEEKNNKNKGGVLGPRRIDEKVEEEGRRKLLMSENDIDDEKLKNKYDDADADDDNGNNNGNDDDIDDIDDIINEESDLDATDSDDDNETDSDDDSDDSDDEEDLLQAELAKIKAEREKAKAKADAEAAAEEQERLEEAALIGNPLLNASAASALDGGSGRVKRKWNDDVVFRNQAKGEPELNKKRFINDTVRNDFHKRFLNKFIR